MDQALSPFINNPKIKIQNLNFDILNNISSVIRENDILRLEHLSKIKTK